MTKNLSLTNRKNNVKKGGTFEYSTYDVDIQVSSM